MELIIQILGIASVMNLIHETPLYHRILKAASIDVKPFTCVLCSTFWVTLGFSVFEYGFTAILIAGITAIIAELINIQIHKI